jgi:hypothetical protein
MPKKQAAGRPLTMGYCEQGCGKWVRGTPVGDGASGSGAGFESSRTQAAKAAIGLRSPAGSPPGE